MKKVFQFFLAFSFLFLGIHSKSLAQAADTTAVDFFASKWEISVVGTPNGDIKFLTELLRKEGKLSGELKVDVEGTPTAIPISNIEDTKEQITIYFSAQGYDLNLVLNKVDQDTLKGSLAGMFDSSAKRVKDK